MTHVTEEDGCHLHDACLTCPFPACVYDDSQAVATYLYWQRCLDVAKRYRRGDGSTVIAKRLGVNRRTVARMLAHVRAHEPYRLISKPANPAAYKRAWEWAHREQYRPLNRKKAKRFREYRKEQGRCTRCGGPKDGTAVVCQSCRDAIRGYNRTRLGDHIGRVAGQRQAAG